VVPLANATLLAFLTATVAKTTAVRVSISLIDGCCPFFKENLARKFARENTGMRNITV